MSIMKKLLELYKETLEWENYERTEIHEVPASEEEYTKILEKKEQKQILEKPIEGVVFELVPSLDAQEMIFLIFKVNEDFTTIMPLSKWWEFATSKDVLVEIERRPYIVQTDIPLDIPTRHFHTWFGDKALFEITKLNGENLERIEKVYKGIEKGDGKILSPEKEEFKNLEAERYLPLWLGVVNQTEELAELNEELISLKQKEMEEALLRAHEKQPIHGKGKNLEFFYDKERELLSIFPKEEFIGKNGKVVFEFKENRIILYEGIIKEEIKIPLKSEAYDYKLFTEGLKIEPIQ